MSQWKRKCGFGCIVSRTARRRGELARLRLSDVRRPVRSRHVRSENKGKAASLTRSLQKHTVHSRDAIMRFSIRTASLLAAVGSIACPALDPSWAPQELQNQSATPRNKSETVIVKYRGPVNLGPFQCEGIARSSFINEVCCDKGNKYMLIKLNDTWYHYCGIDDDTVTELLNASSMGHYYNASIKRSFDCRVGHVPQY